MVVYVACKPFCTFSVFKVASQMCKFGTLWAPTRRCCVVISRLYISANDAFHLKRFCKGGLPKFIGFVSHIFERGGPVKEKIGLSDHIQGFVSVFCLTTCLGVSNCLKLPIYAKDNT